jgi:hypothetical protein
MDRVSLRLDLLRLTYTNARDAGEAVARAKVLEEYAEAAPQKTPEVQKSGTLGLPNKADKR